ncbi:MAG: endo-1,4-beta-xylanase [Solirubrobacterales bacterium]|nr:endo-1,4-beta-xylanase [Solirubrobacterales bacterium]
MTGRTTRSAAIAVAFGLAVVTAYTQTRPGAEAKPLPGTPLRELAQAEGRRVGTAVQARALERDRAYGQLVAGQFSSVTPENEMKWDVVAPEQGTFEFGPADEIVGRAHDAGQVVRGHTLVWHSQTPGWLGPLDAEELRAAMLEHIARVAGHFRGRVATWDVVNEAITDRGRLRRSVFLQRLGPGYVAQAFRAAREADPDAKLFINDFGIEGINPKSDRLYALVRELKAQGAPVDGVGFQMHVNLKGVPADFAANLRRFVALGVEVAVTEADVALRQPASEGDLAAQARVFTDALRGCLEVAKCRSFTFWGFTDSRSWIPENQPGFGRATLLDSRLRPKPAYEAVQRALGP